MMEIVDEHVFPFLRTLGEEGSSYGRHMEDARLGFSNAGLLSKVVDLLDKIPIDDRPVRMRLSRSPCRRCAPPVMP